MQQVTTVSIAQHEASGRLLGPFVPASAQTVSQVAAGELLQMFKACVVVIRCDIQSARFLIPYLLQCVLSAGSSDSRKGESPAITPLLLAAVLEPQHRQAAHPSLIGCMPKACSQHQPAPMHCSAMCNCSVRTYILAPCQHMQHACQKDHMSQMCPALKANSHPVHHCTDLGD